MAVNPRKMFVKGTHVELEKVISDSSSMRPIIIVHFDTHQLSLGLKNAYNKGIKMMWKGSSGC